MVDRIPHSWTLRRDGLIRLAERNDSGTSALLIDFSVDLDAALNRHELTASVWAQLAFTCSSLLINLGGVRGDRASIERGIHRAQSILDRNAEPELSEQIAFNIANGRSALHIVTVREWRDLDPDIRPGLLALRDRETLRAARRGFFDVGYSVAPADTRGRALCNLGNELDHSGRWVEAYQAYVDALVADPTNGNAAGNAAELLRIRMARGRGLPGHYAAVYENYRKQALRNRARTVELAGEEVAARWDALPPAKQTTVMSRTTGTS